jgi:hypothetical protein
VQTHALLTVQRAAGFVNRAYLDPAPSRA